MTGSNNDSDFTYIGFIKNDTFIYGNKSRISNEAIGVKAFTSVHNLFEKGIFHKDLAFFHEGCCGRCGMKLTTPESVQRGFGPECIGLVGR